MLFWVPLSRPSLPMADPTLLTIAESVKLQPPSKWHWSLSYFASRLGITPEQAASFLDCIE